MTIEQMAKSLKSVGACFAVSSAKHVSPNDPQGSPPSYHIHPDAEDPQEKHIKRVYSQAQLLDWVRTKKAAARCQSSWDEQILWNDYQERWS